MCTRSAEVQPSALPGNLLAGINEKKFGAGAGAAPSSVPEVSRSRTKHLRTEDPSLPLPGLTPPAFQGRLGLRPCQGKMAL